MSKEHHYTQTIIWTGNKGVGTLDYKSYERSHTISIQNKVDILASSDAPFRGDITKHNPEDFLLSSLSSCHMLWFLHLCADHGIVVESYADNPSGILTQSESNGGKFTSVTLNPIVYLSNSSMQDKI